MEEFAQIVEGLPMSAFSVHIINPADEGEFCRMLDVKVLNSEPCTILCRLGEFITSLREAKCGGGPKFTAALTRPGGISSSVRGF